MAQPTGDEDDWEAWEKHQNLLQPDLTASVICTCVARSVALYRNPYTGDIMCGACGKTRPHTCPCGNVYQYVIEPSTGDVICEVCARVNSFIPIAEKVYRRTSEPYKRKNYARYLIQLYCGIKGQAEYWVTSRVSERLDKHNLSAHPNNIRDVIKAMKLKHQVHNAGAIASALGYPLPKIQEETLVAIEHLFQYIETFFNRVRGSRRYFLHYPYVLYFLTLRLHRPDIAECIPRIKTENRRKVNDELWDNICNLADLKFSHNG